MSEAPVSRDAPVAPSKPHWLAGLLAWGVRMVSGPRVVFEQELDDLRPRVFFANHTSNLDAVVMWAALPPELRAMTRPAAAKDYWDGGAVRRFLAVKVFRAILVERRPTDMTEDVRARARRVGEYLVDELGPHSSLIIFPEGLRGDGRSILPFKSGLYYLLKARPEMEAVPVYLENLNRILPKGELFPVPLMSGVHVGPPLHLHADETKEAFLTRARDALVRLSKGREVTDD